LEAFQHILASTFGILPELVLMLGIVYLLLSMLFISSQSYSNYFHLSTILILFIYLVISTLYYGQILKNNSEFRLFNGLLLIDIQSLFFKQLIVSSGIIMLIHIRVFKYYFEQEIYFIFLNIILGLCIASMTTHFIVLLLSLELVSLGTYVLVLNGRKKINYEAAIKYFIFGCATTGIMLYGVSLFYGLTYSLDFSTYTTVLFAAQKPAAIQILGSLVLGIVFFKTAAFPFHSWLPDVYETTETPFLSFLSFAPKAVGFLILGRFLSYDFFDALPLLVLIIIGCLLVGNLSALWQNHSKRLLGFSGIAQTGFILIGFLTFKKGDFYGANYYILSYLPITMASFWLIDILSQSIKTYDIRKYLGWGQKNIVLAVNSVIIMMALVGLPPTIGFTAKLVIFGELLSNEIGLSRSWAIAFITFGLLNMAISIYYYLRIPFYLLIKNPKGGVLTLVIDFKIIILTYFSLIIIYLFFFSDMIGSIIDKVIK
jgi:NADH-quinone oxidoreductase subunit N